MIATTSHSPLFHQQNKSSCNEGLLVKIPKKEDSKDFKNYREITLLPIPSKILSRIILERISDAVLAVITGESI